MVARPRSTSQKLRFSASWIDVDQVKAKSPHSEKKKIGAKFCPAFLKAKLSVHRSAFWFATKTLVQKIMLLSRKRFARHTPTSLTKRSTEFETGRAGDARLPVSNSVLRFVSEVGV